MKLLKTRIALAVGLLSAGSVALAGEATTTFGVSATVEDACDVSAEALDFNSFDTAVTNEDQDATSTIDVTCSNGTTYDIALDAGANSTDVTARKMSDGNSGDLSYALYSDSGRTENWGETNQSDTVAGTGDGTTQTETVYGQVPKDQQTAPTGNYSDTINVTVTY